MKSPTRMVSHTPESLAQLTDCQRILADRAEVPTKIPASQVIRKAIAELHLRLTAENIEKNGGERVE